MAYKITYKIASKYGEIKPLWIKKTGVFNIQGNPTYEAEQQILKSLNFTPNHGIEILLIKEA